jgi:hypothetical protein
MSASNIAVAELAAANKGLRAPKLPHTIRVAAVWPPSWRLKQFHHFPASLYDSSERDGAERMHCEFAPYCPAKSDMRFRLLFDLEITRIKFSCPYERKNGGLCPYSQ